MARWRPVLLCLSSESRRLIQRISIYLGGIRGKLCLEDTTVGSKKRRTAALSEIGAARLSIEAMIQRPRSVQDTLDEVFVGTVLDRRQSELRGPLLMRSKHAASRGIDTGPAIRTRATVVVSPTLRCSPSSIGHQKVGWRTKRAAGGQAQCPRACRDNEGAASILGRHLRVSWPIFAPRIKALERQRRSISARQTSRGSLGMNRRPP